MQMSLSSCWSEAPERAGTGLAALPSCPSLQPCHRRTEQLETSHTCFTFLWGLTAKKAAALNSSSSEDFCASSELKVQSISYSCYLPLQTWCLGIFLFPPPFSIKISTQISAVWLHQNFLLGKNSSPSQIQTELHKTRTILLLYTSKGTTKIFRAADTT